MVNEMFHNVPVLFAWFGYFKDSKHLISQRPVSCVSDGNIVMGICWRAIRRIVDHSKFLGLTIDVNLKFHQRVVNLCGRLAFGCFSGLATFLELGYEMAHSVYFALVESHLRYAFPFCGSCPQYLGNAVFVLQKKAVRGLCVAHPWASCIFVKYGLLILPALFILETVCLIHKNRNQFPQPNRIHATPHENSIPLPIPHFSLEGDSLIYKGIKIYNHLSPNFKSMVNLR